MAKVFFIVAVIALNIILAATVEVDVITDGDTRTDGKPKRNFFGGSGLGGYPVGSQVGYGAYPVAGAYQQFQQQQLGYGVGQGIGGYKLGLGNYGLQQPYYGNSVGYAGYPGLGYGGLGGKS